MVNMNLTVKEYYNSFVPWVSSKSEKWEVVFLKGMVVVTLSEQLYREFNAE